MGLGMASLSGQDVIVKLLSSSYSVWQVFMLRGTFALLVLATTLTVLGQVGSVRTRRPGMQLLRGGMAFGAFTCYYLAVAAMPLLDALAIFYVSPLMATAFSAVLLRETVSAARWLAVAVGFAGAMIMIQPGFGIVHPAAWLSLIAAVAYGLVVILTRSLGATETSASIALYTMLPHIILSLPMVLLLQTGPDAADRDASYAFLTRAWVLPGATDVALMAVAGFMLAIGFVCLAKAYALVRVALVAPFEYAAIVWAALWGYVFWSDLPTAPTVIGAVLVVGAGLYNLYGQTARPT